MVSRAGPIDFDLIDRGDWYYEAMYLGWRPWSRAKATAVLRRPTLAQPS